MGDDIRLPFYFSFSKKQLKLKGAIMPSTNNLPEQGNLGKPKCCVFCHFTILQIHSHYERKGTHSRTFENQHDPITVTCWRCQNPNCRRIFSVLPPGTLPYCRFRSEDVISIASQFQEGKSAYAVWKSWASSRLGLKVFVRLRVLILRVLLFITAWAREIEQSIHGSLKSLCQSIINRVSWTIFTTRLYHALYPRRLWPEANPHNSAP
ncbi:hypothetical protein ACFL5V_13295 [Fibrobacterota bacterium]